MTIGDRIKQARVEAGLSQGDLAKRIGVSRQRVSQIEEGCHTPQSRTIKKITDALGCEAVDLLTHTPDPDTVKWSKTIKASRKEVSAFLHKNATDVVDFITKYRTDVIMDYFLTRSILSIHDATIENPTKEDRP